MLIAFIVYVAGFLVSSVLVSYSKALLWPMVILAITLSVTASIMRLLENALFLIGGILRFYSIRCLDAALFGAKNEKDTSATTSDT